MIYSMLTSCLCFCIILMITLSTCIPLIKEPPPSGYISTVLSHKEKTNTQQPHPVNCNTQQSTSPSRSSKACSTVPSTRQLEEERTQTRSQKKKKKPNVDFSHLFREESNQYPDEEIKVALKQTSNHLKELFNVLNTPLDPNVNLTERIAHHADDDLNERDGSREESICKSVIRNIYPREAKRENTLVYIPNNQDFMQVIQAEICQFPNEECNYLADNLPYGMSSSCHQKYAYKKLLYLDSLEKRMASDLFPYPSCCSCHVKISPFDLRSLSNSSSSITETNSRIKESTNDKKKANESLTPTIEAKLEETPEFVAISQSDSGVNKPQLGSTSKRQAKALETQAVTFSSIVTLGEVEPSPVQKVVTNHKNLEERNINNRTTSVAKKPSKPATQPTIVLLEDKVYTPGS